MQALSIVSIHGIKQKILPNNIRALSVVFIHGIKQQILLTTFGHGVSSLFMESNSRSYLTTFRHRVSSLFMESNCRSYLTAFRHWMLFPSMESQVWLSQCQIFFTCLKLLHVLCMVLWSYNCKHLVFFLSPHLLILSIVFKYIFASLRTPHCPHSWLGIMHHRNVHYYYHY